MNNRQQIHIIGGGIAGLSLALACKNKGVDYELYERNAEITYQNVGLGISANLFPIFEKWGILKETKQIGTEIKNFNLVDQHMKSINSFVLDKPPLSVNRRLFYALIHSKLENKNIHVNTPKTVADFSEGEIVISAEGIHSQTRKILHPQIKLRDSNQILWRGISESKLNEKFKESYYDFVGNNLRFAIIHLGHDYYSWYAIMNKQHKEETTKEKEFLIKKFKDYHPVVVQVIEQSQDVYFSELVDIDPQKRKWLKWSVNNNLMIGDAIHPTTPNMANGACLAMEDSYLLGELIMDRSMSNEMAFTEFQKRRTKKINAIVNQSWMFGKILHQKNTAVDYLLKIALKIMPNWFFNKIYSNVLVDVKD